MKKLFLFFGVVFGAFWRRWLGTTTKISRIWKIFILYAFVLVCYLLFDMPRDYKGWLCFAWVSTWFMAFWNMSHGDYFCVNDTSVDEGRLKWVDWCLRLIYGEGKYYNFKGNVTGLFIRYTVPAVLCCLFMPTYWFCLGGFFVAFIYGLCGKLFPNRSYTEIAEYIAGGLCFGLFTICFM